MIEDHDQEEGYCRSLGHSVRFAYCRAGARKLPCARIADCWFERFPVVEFLSGHYSREDLDRIFAPPPGKIESILAILEGVKERTDGP